MLLVEYQTILKYCLLVLLFPTDEIYPNCRKACLDSVRDHVVHFRELSSFKYRYDMVRDGLFNVFMRVEVSAKKEELVNFLTNPLKGISTLRSTNILFLGG